MPVTAGAFATKICPQSNEYYESRGLCKVDLWYQSIHNLPSEQRVYEQRLKFYGWLAPAHLKVPKCEILDRSDFYYFYTIKPFWAEDFVVKILTYYFIFWGSQASFIFWCVSWAYA